MLKIFKKKSNCCNVKIEEVKSQDEDENTSSCCAPSETKENLNNCCS